MKLEWFTQWGVFYRPVSIDGWVLTITVFTVISRISYLIVINSSSTWGALIVILPWAAISLMALQWIASKTCKNEVYNPTQVTTPQSQASENQNYPNNQVTSE